MDRPYTLENADWLDDPALGTVLGVLGAEDGRAMIVGGAVRNALMKRPVDDIDIAVRQTPERVVDLARAAGLTVHPTGLKHGTVTLVAGEGEGRRGFEVTSLRVDVETDGRRAKVQFTDDWSADARRRDFTLNALYCSERGEVLDPVGGLNDLRERRIRFVGEPAERIREDHLRILRFFRFHAWFGEGEPDRAALEACIDARKKLRTLSRERVRRELFKLLAAPSAVLTVDLMIEHGILSEIFPGRLDPNGFRKLAEIETKRNLDADPLRRLRALSRDPTAADLQTAFALANDETKRLARLERLPTISPAFRRAERQALLYWHGAEAVIDRMLLDWSDGPHDVDDPERTTVLGEALDWRTPELPVNGRDLRNAGIEEGEELGHLLHALEDWWVASGLTADKGQLMARLETLRRERTRMTG